jgi:trans-aconitate methyltransferase
MLLYTPSFSPWYRLLDPHEEHAEEAASYRDALERGASGRAETLLELGAGAGNNAWHLKQRFRCTLSDLSEDMLALSRELNPDCEHVPGDMRTLRLGRTFDAVLVHDAVMYMTTEADLAQAIRTAFEHTRPGGSTVFAPDFTRETFRDETILIEGNDGKRSLRAMEWAWDPDPNDDTSVAEYVFALRENGEVMTFHDHTVEGLFPQATWLRLLESAGYRVESTSRARGDGTNDEVFLCRRP